MSKLYKRPNGIYYIRYQRAGKVKWKSLKTRDARVATSIRKRLDRALLRESYEKHAPFEPVNLTFAALQAHYTRWAADRRRPGTIYLINLELTRFQKMTGCTHLAYTNKAHVASFQENLRATGMLPRTVNRSLRALRAVVNFALKLELYKGRNPFAQFDPLPVRKSIPQWLSVEQMYAVLAAAERHGRDAHLIFALGIYAGLRKEEIIAARWEWLNFDTRTLYVRGSQDFFIKDKEERAIDLNSTLAEILNRYRADDGYIVRPRNLPGINRYRFEMRKTFIAVAKEAGVTWCTPKRLRYTFASQLVSNGADLYYVQRQLGHSTPHTTMVYAHLAPNKEMIDRIPAPTAPSAETHTNPGRSRKEPT